jgi:hypothetical protein
VGREGLGFERDSKQTWWGSWVFDSVKESRETSVF